MLCILRIFIPALSHLFLSVSTNFESGAWDSAEATNWTLCRAVVFFGRRQLKPSVNWMGAFWLSTAGAAQCPEHLCCLHLTNALNSTGKDTFDIMLALASHVHLLYKGINLQFKNSNCIC